MKFLRHSSKCLQADGNFADDNFRRRERYNPFTDENELDFFRKYRFTKPAFINLYDILAASVERNTKRWVLTLVKMWFFSRCTLCERKLKMNNASFWNLKAEFSAAPKISADENRNGPSESVSHPNFDSGLQFGVPPGQNVLLQCWFGLLLSPTPPVAKMETNGYTNVRGFRLHSLSEYTGHVD